VFRRIIPVSLSVITRAGMSSFGTGLITHVGHAVPQLLHTPFTSGDRLAMRDTTSWIGFLKIPVALQAAQQRLNRLFIYEKLDPFGRLQADLW